MDPDAAGQLFFARRLRLLSGAVATVALSGSGGWCAQRRAPLTGSLTAAPIMDTRRCPSQADPGTVPDMGTPGAALPGGLRTGAG